MSTSVDLWMSFDGASQLVLSIPVNECKHFSKHPLTWLRYIGFTIYGNEGYISTSPNGQEVNYYESDIQAGSYYYISQGDALLLDPALMDDRTSDDRASDASTLSTSWSDFRSWIMDRDGTCVMSGSHTVTACHIIPHAKGHQYITNLAHHRDGTLDPPLESINDTRNGILLFDGLHRPFGASRLAFLRTPNFAMTTDDVDLALQPEWCSVGFVVHPLDTESRITLQFFNFSDPILNIGTPHNSDARLAGGNDCPPPVIFDVAYGCAVLKAWGVPEFIVFAQKHTRDIYYDNGGDNGGRGGGGDKGVDSVPTNRVRDRAEEVSRHGEQSGVGRQATSKEDRAPDIADIIFGLWTHNARKGERQAKAIKADKAREKVRAWLGPAE